MPGTRLSQIESSAQKWWENENKANLLKSVSIESRNQTGLRGITSLKIEFNSPVTVISGKNGAGKSTILALAALGFHGDKKTVPRMAKNGKHYTFNDFFFKGPSDPKLDNIEIKWSYKGDLPPLEIDKKTNKWMHYERRPKNHSEYIGISRCIPAFEQNVLKQIFPETARPEKTKKLDEDGIKNLSHIIGISYNSAEEKTIKKHKIRECTANNSYSSFNMGAGEDIVIELLAILLSLPQYSIVCIEEIETGLHPSAQKKLALLLPKIALDKKIQIITTSHSEHIIDNLPRNSRILITKTGEHHEALYGVSTRYALGELLESTQSELKIFCEDPLCKKIIEHTLPLAIKKRVQIIAAGADSEILNHAWSHTISGEKHKTLVIWDGDVKFSQIKNWHKTVNSRNETYNKKHKTAHDVYIGILKLTDTKNPEEWIIDKVTNSIDIMEDLRTRFKLPNTDYIKESLDAAKNNPDHHNLFYTLSERFLFPENAIQSHLIELICSKFQDEFTHIIDYTQSLLD